MQFVGLRPGEKLYEELLIEDAPLVTAHPRIRKAMESYLPTDQLNPWLEKLRQAVAQRDPATLRQILCDTVREYTPNSDLVDNVYVERHAHDRMGGDATSGPSAPAQDLPANPTPKSETSGERMPLA
ncbi:polysaccharide biosynthesis protein [Sphingomonas sp. 179-A 2A2 NHS]|uniref:polysaccharide biosynthesis protein n=1 Tax=Sphingomonas sp. 179-A 2A2 NHS TaxID=3374290 RepID=UPI00387A69C1